MRTPRCTTCLSSQREWKPGWRLGRVDWALPTQRGAGFIFELELTGSRGTAELSLGGGGVLTSAGAVVLHDEEQLAGILLDAQIEPAHCLASLRGQLRRNAPIETIPLTACRYIKRFQAERPMQRHQG